LGIGRVIHNEQRFKMLLPMAGYAKTPRLMELLSRVFRARVERVMLTVPNRRLL
jgi:hypothetical protein